MASDHIRVGIINAHAVAIATRAGLMCHGTSDPL